MDLNNIKDDKLLFKIPIFLNQTNDSINLLKYPLRKKNRKYRDEKDIEDLKNFKIKPKSKKIKIKFKLNTNSVHFSEQNNFPNENLILSSRLIENKCNYALFNYVDQKIILTPVRNIFLMVPDFSYLTKKFNSLSNIESSQEKIKTEESPEKMTAVIQKLRSVEKTNEMTNFTGSNEYLMSVEEEEWINLEQNKKVNSFRQILEKKIFNDSFIKAGMGKNEYLLFIRDKKSIILPGFVKSTDFIKSGMSNQLIRDNLKTYDQKTLAILKNCHLATFDEILKILKLNPEKCSLKERIFLIKSLSALAYFIHGVWVIKSEIIYESRLMHARDYLLTLFWLNPEGFVLRKDWLEISKLNNEDSLDIIQKLSILDKKTKRWNFKKKCLNFKFYLKEFLSQEIIDKQRLNLQRLHAISYRILTGWKKQSFSLNIFDEENFRQSKKQLQIFKEEIFNKYFLCSMQFLKRKLLKNILNSGISSSLAFLSKDEFEENIKKTCLFVKDDLYVLKNTKNVISNKLKESFLYFMSQNKEVKKREIENFFKTLNSKTISSVTINKIISQYCAATSKKTFKLKSGNYKFNITSK